MSGGKKVASVGDQMESWSEPQAQAFLKILEAICDVSRSLDLDPLEVAAQAGQAAVTMVTKAAEAGAFNNAETEEMVERIIEGMRLKLNADLGGGRA